MDKDTKRTRRSEWDTPTPSGGKRGDYDYTEKDRSVRSIYQSERRRQDDRRANRNRRPEDTVRSLRDDPVPHFQDDNERLEWEEEQKMLDREWYDNDGGYDDEYNPFAKVVTFWA